MVKDVLEKWQKTAKYVNLHILAVSALIKKLALLNWDSPVFPVVEKDPVRNYVLFAITSRFEKLLLELDSEWKSIVSTEFANEMDIALHRCRIKLDQDFSSNKIDQEEIEFGNLVVAKIDELRNVSLVDNVIQLLARGREMSKLAILSDMLDDKLENRFTLPVWNRNEKQNFIS